MRLTITIILILAFNFVANGQIFKRISNETPDQFIARVKPDSLKVAHSVIETSIWTSDKKAIIAFLGYDEPDPNHGFNLIMGFIYYPITLDTYRVVALEAIEEDGGLPEVISVFFVNADSDNAKELGLLCKYAQQHYDYYGDLYKGFIYDNPTADKKSLMYDKKLLDKFWGCDCDFRESESTKAKFKTAQDIKAELKRMGY